MEENIMETANRRSFEALLQGKNQFFAVIIMILMMTLVFPPAIFNVLLPLIIALSLAILMITIFKKEMLEFSFFPGFLLIVTILRLSINISLAFIILSGRGMTIDMINFFGNLTIGNDYIAGIAIFAILVLIQTIEASKGGERVVEVAARFIMDAMPIKAMAIDADLNSGAIDQTEAAARRLSISQKASFFSSMTGTSRFVKNDAIASIIITVILSAGVAISAFSADEATAEAIRRYILLTIGAGLVIYIPALFIATSTGLIVTRMASDTNA